MAVAFLGAGAGAIAVVAAELALDESPAGDGEWGYRPAAGSTVQVSPPSFCWRPQKDCVAWEIECSLDENFRAIQYHAPEIRMNVHCPAHPFPPGTYFWRYRGVDQAGNTTAWSQARSFAIPATASPFPMPSREELIARIPRSHPRLFIRPEDLPRLRELADGALAEQYQKLISRCDKLVANPPPTEEPEKYPPGMVRGSSEWRDLWWGNRTYTITALDGAATLGFARLLSKKEEYGQLAKRILLDCAQWDPQGATGYQYNDEAGMPYAYHFARTYTFIHDLLTEEERSRCRHVMKIRGEEMYRHLYPRHLWMPYASHSNRAWHFLGEVGIAFLDEIEAADDWVWFAMNVFYNVYPVWSDEDGGWHEGISYWSSYMGRFTWWADVMRTAMGIDAYQKPYFKKAGDYPLYLMPPGTIGGGFGDGANRYKASQVVPLCSQLAAQAGNGYWQWYVEQMGGPIPEAGYIGLVRGMLPPVKSVAPDNLPVSRLFRGTGQAYLNTTLLNADQNVQIVFKSSQMGTQSHGNEGNNSFVLWAYGQRLLVRSGHYYNYGGDHHRGWVWSTRSLNNITVNGMGQIPRSPSAKGNIIAFQTTPSIDSVVGEAGSAYRDLKRDRPDDRILERYTRAILFVKPELAIIFDRLEACEPATFEYWLHAVNAFQLHDQQKITVQAENVACQIQILTPQELVISQT
ncbi:MAG: DUF4962 domain-containing protein, partial [Pirellulales bacterium]|nr:DUF4962 domain-containing protein [Pirellulales bacterium]